MQVRLRLSRHLVYNLSKPQDSLLLLAPLAKAVGGYATGSSEGQTTACPPTFLSTQDPDFQKILVAIRRVSDELTRIKRFDMPGFRPRPEYLREMKRFGILPAAFDDRRDPVNPYLLDEQYWQTCSCQPSKVQSGG